jgi:hypothetical protein
VKIPPALAASATPRILELLPPPPARVLEVAFGGIHATPLRLAGYDVEVLDDDPRAAQRAGVTVDAPAGRYDAVVAPETADLAGVERGVAIVVDALGSARAVL